MYMPTMTTLLCISSLIMFLVGPSSATFQHAPTIIPLYGAPGVWRGNPAVNYNIPNRTYRICADDTYWNATIADVICQYFGFEGAMIIKENVPVVGSELDGYVVCKLDIGWYAYSATLITCERTDVCDSVPTISCFLPGYRGCYSHTEASPFFPSGVTAPVDGQPYDIQTCAAACTGSPYLGLTDGQVCICGSELGTGDEGFCDVPCQADDLQACGGDTAISTYGANVIGRCNPERGVVPPHQPYHITSPNFPDSYVPGESCTWIMDISGSYHIKLNIPLDLNVNTSDIVVIELSGRETNTVFSLGETGRHIISEPTHSPNEKDTLTVQFKTDANGTSHTGAGFSMRILISAVPTKTTEAPSHAGQNHNMSKLAIAAAMGLLLFAVLLA